MFGTFFYFYRMNVETLREYCSLKKGATEDFPFGETTLVFKVMNKIFLLASLDASPLQFNAKCDPDKAIELRERYDAVQPGYHMNKKHWNTVIIDGSVPQKLLRKMIDDSYELIVQSLSKKEREKLI
jgi:predicted DNA-binding protein (MmcQ/YjbR family)